MVVFGVTMFCCTRAQGKRERVVGEGGGKGGEGGEGPGSWEMGDRRPKEGERVRSHADYEVRDEDEEGINPFRDPVRVEDRV